MTQTEAPLTSDGSTVSSQLGRDNHYVPRLYLKRWADDQGRVWAYRTLVSHPNVPLWKRASIRGVAYHAHLYTRVVAAGETDEVENWLADEFETPAEKPIRKVIANDRLSSDDWQCLVRFLAAQDVRTPGRLMEMVNRWHQTLPDLIENTLTESVRELEAARRTGQTVARTSTVDATYFPGKITSTIEPGAETGILKFETVAGRGLWLFALRHLLTRTIDALLAHRWTILRPPRESRWATSDDPVVRLNYYGDGKYDFRGGWGSRGTEILLPLGPEHLMYARIGERPPQKGQRVSDSLFDALQRFTFEHAHRFVFADQEDSRVTVVRPRIVDADLYRSEIDQWRRWHQEQADGERALLK